MGFHERHNLVDTLYMYFILLRLSIRDLFIIGKLDIELFMLIHDYLYLQFTRLDK